MIDRARQFVRWGVGHGFFRRIVRKRMEQGDLGARLMMDPVLFADPYPHYDVMRDAGRLVGDDFVLDTAHHDVVTEILRSPDFGVTGGPTMSAPVEALIRFGGRGPLGAATPPSLLAIDPPDHTRIRKLVTRAFSVRAVTALRSRTEEIADGLLDEMAGNGATTDVIRDYASLLPATVITEMLGAPADMRRAFLEWGEGGARSLDGGLPYGDFRRAEANIQAMQDWMVGHFDHLRRNPGDNILSHLVRAHDEDERLSEDELISIAMLLLAAGFETTVNLIGNGVATLCAHPDQLEVLREHPGHWPNAVEEILRFDSPVQRTGRTAHRATEVAGVRVPKGRIVVLLLGGANRDPAVFTDPHRFDVARDNADQHISFSNGAHFCPGASLARMEGEVGLRKLFARFPDLSVEGTPDRRPTRVLRGYHSLPVRLTPATVGTS